MAQKETVQQGKQRETELPDLFFNELKLQKKKHGQWEDSWPPGANQEKYWILDWIKKKSDTKPRNTHTTIPRDLS